MDRIVIVGGGIIGTSIAFHLRDADRPVQLLEKDMLGAGATAKSAAMFTQHHVNPDPADIEFRKRSWEWYRERIRDGAFTFDRIGTLDLARSEAHFERLRNAADVLAAADVDVELVDGETIESFGITADALRGGLHLPADGVLDPAEIVQYFADEARAGGVAIETDVEVTDIATADGDVEAVITDDGTIEADLVINAAGPWAPVLNEFAGISTPIRHSLGPIVVLESRREVSLPFTFFEEGLYLREEGDFQLFAGVHNRYEEGTRLDPAHARTVDEELYLEIADVAEKYLPQHADLEVSNEWVGLRTLTPDDRPLVGETGIGGFYLATGMGGYGVTLAPTIGEIVAGDVLDGATTSHQAGLSPERFSEMETGQ